MGLHFSKKEFSNRKSNVLNSMKDQNLNALLMFKQESMYWLTGYDTFGFVFFQCLILRDDGEIILQKEVRIDNNDTEHTLADKVLKEEHLIYPEAIKLVLKK